MEKFNLAGCTGVVAVRNLPLDSQQIKDMLAKKIGEGSYPSYQPRCLLAAYPAGGRGHGRKYQGVEAALRGAGGFIIWNTHSAHNAGQGMNIWLIPGVKGGEGLYEGSCNPEKSQPACAAEISEEQRLNVIALNTAKPARKKKKRINWKQKYLSLTRKKRSTKKGFRG